MYTVVVWVNCWLYLVVVGSCWQQCCSRLKVVVVSERADGMGRCRNVAVCPLPGRRRSVRTGRPVAWRHSSVELSSTAGRDERHGHDICVAADRACEEPTRPLGPSERSLQEQETDKKGLGRHMWNSNRKLRRAQWPGEESYWWVFPLVSGIFSSERALISILTWINNPSSNLITWRILIRFK